MKINNLFAVVLLFVGCSKSSETEITPRKENQNGVAALPPRKSNSNTRPTTQSISDSLPDSLATRTSIIRNQASVSLSVYPRLENDKIFVRGGMEKTTYYVVLYDASDRELSAWNFEGGPNTYEISDGSVSRAAWIEVSGDQQSFGFEVAD